MTWCSMLKTTLRSLVAPQGGRRIIRKSNELGCPAYVVPPGVEKQKGGGTTYAGHQFFFEGLTRYERNGDT